MDFKEIDTKSLDFTNAPLFRKTATLSAASVEVAEEEQEVITVFADKGHEETRNTAHPGDRIVTGPKGERYVLDAEKFEKMYEIDPTDPETYISKNKVRGILLQEDVTFEAPWGGPMNMKAGSTIVKAGENDIYGIEEDTFAMTYGRAKEGGELICGLDIPLAEQRQAVAEAGAISHLRDIDERKAFNTAKALAEPQTTIDKER